MSTCRIVDEDGTARSSCDLDDLFTLLATSHRRRLVTVLERTDDDWIARERLLSTVAATTGVDERTLRRKFVHVHRPMLEDLGLIDYDDHSEAIRYYRCECLSDVVSLVDRWTDS